MPNLALPADPDVAVLVRLFRYVMDEDQAELLARTLLRQTGSLSNLLDSSVEDLMGFNGVSQRVAQLIALIPQLLRYTDQERFGPSPALHTLELATRYCRSLNIGLRHERLHLLCLDGSGRLLSDALLQKGTVNEAAFYPRQVVEEALRHGAGAVILAHNHPGGTLTPSAPDRSSTYAAQEALRHLGIVLLDHIIVARNECFSMRQRGLLHRLRSNALAEGYLPD